MEQEELLLMVTQALESAKSAHKRIDALTMEVSDIHELTAAMAAVSAKVDHLAEDMGEIKSEVTKVAERPAMWWDKLIAAAVGVQTQLFCQLFFCISFSLMIDQPQKQLLRVCAEY